MATKLGLITVGNKRIIEVDSSPVSGFDAPIGSVVLVNESGTGRLYLKIGASSTSWEQIQSGSVDLSPYFKKDGSVLATGDFDLNSNKIKNLASAVNADEAVNKGQMDTQLALKINNSEKGVANGVATLGADGKLPSSQVPAIAITDTFVVNSQSAMLALSTAEQGDIAVRTDLNKSFILVSGSYSVLANWQELLTPTDTVLSVNGQTGVVVLTSTNIAEGSNLYFTEARVLATQLAGLSLASGSAIIDGDSLIVALGKLQKQINDDKADLLAHLNDTVDAHDATAISFVDNGNFTGITDVQGAIYAIDAYISAHVIQDDGSVPMLANLNLNSNKIINLADPTAFTDAVNKQYVDADGGQESIALDNTTKAMTKLKASLTDAGTNSSTKITLPAISSLQVGQTFIIVNPTSTSLSGAGGVYQSDGVTMIGTGFPAGHKGFFTLINKTPETWASHFLILRSGSGYNFANRKLINVTDPTNAQDGATKNYVDGLFTAQGPVWKAPLSATGLNDATADMFFGSKSGDFNIKFYRNNEEFFSMTKSLGVKKLVMSVDRIERTDANFGIVVPNNNLALASLLQYEEAQTFVKVPLFSGPIPVQITEYEKGVNATIADGDATKSVDYTSSSSNSNRRIKVKIMLTSDQGDMFMEKEVHISRANALVLTQDSFTSKESGVNAIECSMSFSAGVLSANLSGMGSLTTKKVVMKCEEISQNP